MSKDFDPDEYLKQKRAEDKFDPDEYLGIKKKTEEVKQRNRYK